MANTDTIFTATPLSLVDGMVAVFFQVGETVIFNKVFNCWRDAPVVSSRVGWGEFILKARKLPGKYTVQILWDGVVAEEYTFDATLPPR